VNRRGADVEVSYSLDGERYIMLRLAHLTAAETLNVGLMCASPEGNGFAMTFEAFSVR
jgi:hypothetical protein